jgi:hypothetical protein
MSVNQTKVPHMDASGSDAFGCDFPLEGVIVFVAGFQVKT